MKDNIKAIFVNWTKPFFFKEDAQGYNKIKLNDLPDNEYDVVDYELLIQKIAVLSAKKYVGQTKLYTDNVGAHTLFIYRSGFHIKKSFTEMGN